jgi:hypothetical protein
MAKRKQIETATGETTANPDNLQEQTELPLIESPSVSPATPEFVSDPVPVEMPPSSDLAAQADSSAHISGKQGDEILSDSSPPAKTNSHWSRSRMRSRYRRYAMLAASVAIAGALGVLTGAAMTGGLSKPVPVAAVEENKAAQESIDRLSQEVASLKASLDAANKSAHGQFVKISERLARASAEVTGAITPPQTVPPTPTSAAPLPPARPAPAAEAPRRPSIITDWTIRERRDGFVYVQGHGDIYQVVLGAPLPGIGPVEQIKRQDGRWVVVTPKGIIVSMRDRRYFEQF